MAQFVSALLCLALSTTLASALFSDLLGGRENGIRTGFNFIPTGNRNDNNQNSENTNEVTNNNNNNAIRPINNFLPEATTPIPEIPKEENNLNNVNSIASRHCVQERPRDVRAHPFDCTKYDICVAGTLITMGCAPGSVFHEPSGSCVVKGSMYDTCSSRQETRLNCPRGATYKKAHPKECAQYYHCGQPAQMDYWEEHLHECPYPMLFNELTNRCEHYSMVQCGARKEPFDACEYRAQNCERSSHCIPCYIRNPSCKGQKDGLNEWKNRTPSPYYIVCSNERVVYQGQCSQAGGPTIFDDVTGMCKLYV